MNDKEEFLAYLKQVSEIVEGWPAWKKCGLNAPEFTTNSTQECAIVSQQSGGYATQSGSVE